MKRKTGTSSGDHSFILDGLKITPTNLSDQMAGEVFMCWHEDGLNAQETAETLGLDVSVVRWQYLIMNTITAIKRESDDDGL